MVLIGLGSSGFIQDQSVLIIHNQEALSSQLDKFITKEFYEDKLSEVKAVFTLKIDSSGEIHSAHIRRSTNIIPKKVYFICHELESKYQVKFMFDRYEKQLTGGKYVYCNYPYFSNR